MTFTYELTPEELEGITDFVSDSNIKSKGKTTINDELTKVVRRFLKATSQRVETKSVSKLKRAFNNASDAKKKQVRNILGV